MRRRTITGYILLLLAILITALPVSADTEKSGKEISWYFIPQKDGSRPPSPAEAPFFSEYDSYYLGKDEKTVYLTFDAGYENGNVEKIVDILDENGVKGAFFILSNFIESNPALVEKMIASGHKMCNHTSKHKNMAKMSSKEEFAAELGKLEEIYKTVTGRDIEKFYRPPEGRFSEKNLAWAKELGYKTIFWSVAYADWDNKNQPDPETALKKLMSRTHNGAIVLLHPTSDTNVKILDKYIKELKSAGYRFGTLDEL